MAWARIDVLRRFPVAEINLPPRVILRMPDDFSALSEIGEALRGYESFNPGTGSDFSLPNTFGAEPKDLTDFR